MSIATRIRQAQEHLVAHPDDGRVVDPPVVVERIGPRSFRASDPAGASVVSAMSADIGGDGAGMTPGTLLRAALVEVAEVASPVLQAMRREVPVRSVVEVGQEVVG